MHFSCGLYSPLPDGSAASSRRVVLCSFSICGSRISCNKKVACSGVIRALYHERGIDRRNQSLVQLHSGPLFLGNSFYSNIHHFPLCLLTPRAHHALSCWHESPSHPPGAKDHVSGILDPFAKGSSGEVVAENWNSVPLGRWSLPDRRACEMSVQRLVSVVRHSQQVSRVNAAMRGPSKESWRKETQ